MGNITIKSIDCKKPLYNQSIASFDLDNDLYDQSDAEGFIKINSVRLKNQTKFEFPAFSNFVYKPIFSFIPI